MAEEEQNIEPLDEAFLEFIANMSINDVGVIDSLDMMELADNDMKIKGTLEDEINAKSPLEVSQESLSVKAKKEEEKP